MGLFGKRKPEFVDLTDMRKRGILKEGAGEEAINGVLDLSSSSSVSSPGSSTSASSSPLGFLGNLAGAGNPSTPAENTSTSNETYSEKLRVARRGNVAEVSNIKVKMEDIEYKLDRFLERLEKIEEKLD